MKTIRIAIILSLLVAQIWRVEAKRPRLVLQTGHKSQINSVQYSPDGSKIATASSDQTIKVWDAATGLLLYTLIGHKDETLDAKFSSTGDSLVSTSRDKTVRLWDVGDAKLIRTFQGNQFHVSAAEIHPYRRQIISVSLDPDVRIWDITLANQHIGGAAQSAAVNAMDISEDGQALATGGDDNIVRLWDLQSRHLQDPIELYGHEAEITSICFSSDGKRLATRSRDNTAIVWDVEKKRQIKTFELYSEEIAFSRDGKMIAGAADDYLTVLLVNIDNGEESRLEGHFDEIICADFSDDASRLVTASIDGRAEIWEVSSGRNLRTLSGVTHVVNGCEVSRTNNLLGTANSSDNIVRLWNFDLGGDPRIIETYIEDIFDIDFSPDGRFVAAGGQEFDGNTLYVGLIEEDSALAVQGHAGIVSAVAFSENSKYVASAAADTVRAQSIEDKSLNNSFAVRNYETITTISFHPNNKYIAVGDYSRLIYLWDFKENKLKYVLEDHDAKISSVIFTSTGDTLISSSDDGSIQFHDAESGRLIRKIENAHGGEPALDLAISPDGKLLASGGYDNAIKLWSLDGGIIVVGSIRNAHSNVVEHLTFKGDDRILISASTDGFIKLWDFTQFSPLAILVGIDESDWAVVAPDGHFDGSPQGVRRLHWVEDNKPLLIEAYFERLFYPRLLSVLVNDRDFLSRIDGGVDEGLQMPPVVKITSPRQGDTIRMNSANLAIKIKTNQYPLAELRFYVNDKLVRLDQTSLPEEDSLEVEVPLVLLAGDNKLRVVGIDKERVESYPEEVSVFREGEPLLSDLYLIAVGISDYKRRSFHLPSARADADSLSSMLGRVNRRNIGAFNHVTILDDNAKKENIRDAFEEVATKAKPEDIFVFYFAGHGITGKEKEDRKRDFFLVLYDVLKISDDQNHLEKYGLSSDELGEMMSKIEANKQVLILDACQSAKAIENLYLDPENITKERAIAQLSRTSGLTTIAAAAATQSAFDIKQLGHGLFTYVLLKGLEGAADADDGDALVTMLEIRSYISKKVPELSKKLIGREQIPSGRSNGQDFPIAETE